MPKIAIRPVWGPLSWFGMGFALFGFLTDRLSKWWLLDVYAIESRGVVEILPFLNFVMAWNRGISYGLFQAETALGKGLLAGFALIVVAVLVLWLARVQLRLMAIAIGLIIGGALGNVYDRLKFGAVADFFSLHANGYYWYIFNIADIWIAVGVILMIYDAFFPGDEEKVASADDRTDSA